MASSSSFTRPWASSSSFTAAPSSSAGPVVLGRLILLRHPNTEANAAGVLQGSTDSPLSEHGERQQDRLCTLLEQDVEDGGGWEVHDLPMMIAHSPLERCARLARRVGEVVGRRRERERERQRVRGFGAEVVEPIQAEEAAHRELGSNTASTSISSSINTAPPLYPSIDLQEKDFGPLECTRRGIHAGPSFPRPSATAKRESKEQFTNRVRRSMRLWIGKLVRTSPPKEGVPPTLLIVTHGLFISTALRILAPQAGPGMAADAPIPFAENTGMYLLEVVGARPKNVDGDAAATAGSGTLTLRLIRANWTPHLAGLTRPRRGGLAAAAADSKQRRLDAFFSPRAGQTPSPKRKRPGAGEGDEDELEAAQDQELKRIAKEM